MRSIVLRSARYMLRRLGLELRPHQASTGPAPLKRLAHPCDAIYQHGDVAFEVPLDKCFYPYHFSYGPSGWHPFVQVLQQYKQNPNTSYLGSILHAYYQAYQPKTVFDAFFVGNMAKGLEAEHLHTLAIPPYQPVFPWDPEAPQARGEKGLASSHGNQGYGPVSDEKGELEFRRLTETYESVKEKGYQPQQGHDGDIRGYFLRGCGDYRFVIRQGLHRSAVLSAMDYEKLRVAFYDPYPRTIFLADIDNWPQVKRGYVSREVAEHIFRMFFEDDGREKARQLGLLD